MLTYMGVELNRANTAIEAAIELCGQKQETDIGVSRPWIAVFDQLRFGYGSAANVSKLLKPSDQASNQRQVTACELREICDVPDDHPILARNVRNAFEHLDERLETWLNDSENQYLHAELIDYGDETLIPMIRQAPIVYHVPTRTLHVMGNEYPLSDLEAAVADARSLWQLGMSRSNDLWSS